MADGHHPPRVRRRVTRGSALVLALVPVLVAAPAVAAVAVTLARGPFQGSETVSGAPPAGVVAPRAAATGSTDASGADSRAPGVAQRAARPASAPPSTPAVAYRRSTALGLPHAGRLRDGVQLPAEGAYFFTWDPIFKTRRNRLWRRYATDFTVRRLLRVMREHVAAHPGAPRVGVGDLSRTRGGPFGPEYGSIGHVSHQNGLDADVYYPRRDRRERPPRLPAQVNRRLAQALVDRFVRAGAEKVFVGLNVRLKGPRGVVEPLAHHDNHLHVRFPNRRRG